MLQTVLNKRANTQKNSKGVSKKKQTKQEKLYLSSDLENLAGKKYFLLTYWSTRRSLGFHKPFI